MTNMIDMITISQATTLAKMIATLPEKDIEKLYYIVEGMKLKGGGQSA
jgi:hypothetical protein